MRMALSQPRLPPSLQASPGSTDRPSYERIPAENWLPDALKSAPSVRAPDGGNRYHYSVRRYTFNLKIVLHSYSACIRSIAHYLVNLCLRKHALDTLRSVEQETRCLRWKFHLAFNEFINGERDTHLFRLDLLSLRARPVPSRQTAIRSVLLEISFVLLALSIFGVSAAGQSSTTSSTENEAWPEADAHVQLPSNWRSLSFVGLEQAADYPFQQWYIASGIGRQIKPILRPHWENIDPDKEHYLFLGGGYEHLWTTNSGQVSHENRIIFDMTPSFRPASRLLLRDRNWVELRWIDGNYSTTYRNLVAAEVDLRVHSVRFTPFGTVEFFYDSPKHSWDQEWYTGGVQLPYKRVFMLETYYRREHCPTCTPQNWNAGGATLNFFFQEKN
jgi:hypothetical protein